MNEMDNCLRNTLTKAAPACKNLPLPNKFVSCQNLLSETFCKRKATLDSTPNVHKHLTEKIYSFRQLTVAMTRFWGVTFVEKG